MRRRMVFGTRRTNAGQYLRISRLLSVNFAHSDHTIMDNGLARFFGVLHFKNTCRCANLTQLANLTTAFSIKWGTVKDNNAFHAFSQALGWIAVLIKSMNGHAIFFKLFVADKGRWIVYLNDTTIINVEFARITRTFTLCL